MFSRSPVITQTGISLLLRAAGGEQFHFTKFVIGDGRMAEGDTEQDASAAVHPVMDATITRSENTEREGYIRLTGSFDNVNLQSSFLWTELGLVAEDGEGNEYLYAYAFDAMHAEYIQAGETAVVAEQTITVIIAVGDTQNITAYVLPRAQYASAQDFQDHITDYNNPHRVTPAQIGAAEAAHTHSAEDINAGVLSVERGGTGVQSLEALSLLLGSRLVAGVYVGDGTQRKDIVLGFQPSAVMVFPMITGGGAGSGGSTSTNYESRTAYVQTSQGREYVTYSVQKVASMYAFYFAPGLNVHFHSLSTLDMKTCGADELLSQGKGGAAVTASGFAVGDNYSQAQRSVNLEGIYYAYIAVR